jgi:hypothetical protein
MKQAKWLLLVAVGIAMVLPGCKKLGDRVNVANTVDDKLVVPILAAESIPVGNINVWNDDDYVYISYVMRTAAEQADQWYLKECYADIELLPRNFPVQKGSGEPDTSRFAYKSGDISRCREYTFTIPVGNWTGSVCAATRSVVCQLSDAVPPVEINGSVGWAGPYPLNRKTSATYFEYTFGDVSGEWHWVNAWAGTEAGQRAFPGDDAATYITHTIGATTNEELYAGQTQCGTVTVTDNVVRGKGKIFVTYHTASSWYAKSCAVEIALEASGIPQVDGNPQPSQFRYKSGALDPYVQEYTITMTFKSGVPAVVIAAHAEAGQSY